MKRVIVLLSALALFAGAGCSDDDDSGGQTTTVELPASGDYAMRIALVELGGLPLDFQLVLVSDPAASVISEATLAPVDDEGVGDVIATVTNVSPDEDGNVLLDFPEAILPAAFSPTTTDVAFDIALLGQVGDNGFCGGITGSIPSVGATLEESTFGTAVWGGPGTAAPSSCEETVSEECERLEAADCPALVSGLNEGFESCGVERSFMLVEPDMTDEEPGAMLPLVFSWHGLGGDSASHMSATGFDDQDGAYFVFPQGRGLTGTEYAQTTTDDNEDLAFFDDMVTCASDQLSVDTERIYSEGMSAGGLFTSYLAVQRADVLASVAPFSGGLIIDYPEPETRIPVLISWGGEDDIAVGQDFDALANSLIDDLTGAGHIVVACNHGEQHTRKPEWSPYALQFLLDHPNGTTTSPYESGGLPEVFPEFCTLESGD